MRSAPSATGGFSPLDEELRLLPGPLTPFLVESLVRLGSWLPFAPAAQLLAHFTSVSVSEPTVRRRTEEAGAAYVALQTEEAAALERDLPAAPAGAAIQQLSVDGAMVPLVQGEWAEVKTLALGTIGEPGWERDHWQVHATELSYFSRLAHHEEFGRLALVETHRRGIETASTVVAVVDGAEWEQGFIDLHCPEAVRILDFPHAAGYVSQAAQAVYGPGTVTTTTWLEHQLQTLKTGDPQEVLAAVRALESEIPATTSEEQRQTIQETIAESVAYLEKRAAQIQYATFQAQGYPIGSGSVESANKLVVEARLKGAGMRWAREQVNPMVALRTVVCSDRWEEAWPAMHEQLRSQARARAKERQAAGQGETPAVGAEAALAAVTEAPTTSGEPLPVSEPVTLPPTQSDPRGTEQHRPPRPWKPAANHPWRHMPIGRARGSQTAHAEN